MRAEIPGIRNEDVFKVVAERYKQSKELSRVAEARQANRDGTSADSLVDSLARLDV